MQRDERAAAGASVAKSIVIENLSFAYDSRIPILKKVSLEVRQGQVVVIIGGSGSGKTTILRNICGQVESEADDVQVMGKSLMSASWQELNDLRKKMGMLFQFGGLFTDLSVLDNVAFPLREHTNWSEASIRDIALLKLEAVGLRGASLLYPSELSGGMARRVALARSVVMDPQLVLYDEPFAGLDPISMSTTTKLIRQLNDALNASSVVVTHDVAESFQIADYVYMLWQGQVVAHGKPEEMMDSDQPYVRQFINAQTEGPLSFHMPAPPLAEQLALTG